MSPPRAPDRPWLLGPIADLLFGCGLGYGLAVAALAGLGVTMDAMRGWLPLVVLVTGVPHYGATLLRVAGSPEARRRHARPLIHFGALVWAVFAISLFLPLLGAIFITLYLTWSPWHYTGQNYGLVMMYLHRGGFAVSPLSRRLVRGWFVLSFALVFLNIHDAASLGDADPLYVAEGGYRFTPLGIPAGVTKIALSAVSVALAAVTIALALHLLRRRGAARLSPVFALVASQAAWFVAPVIVGRLWPGLYGPRGPAALAFIWTAIAHSVQYLWISVYYAKRSGAVRGTARATGWYLGAAVLAGAALWIFPAFVAGPGALGVLPFESGLGLLVASAVNVHHFILDGAIWRLRDARVGDVLVSGARPRTEPEPELPQGSSWIGRAALVAAGCVAVSFWLVSTWEREIGERRAVRAGDLERLSTASRRLSLIGQDGPRIHVALGGLLARRGYGGAALDEYRKSLALAPTPAAWVGIGKIHESRHELASARAAYEAAISLDPKYAEALDHLSQVWLALGGWNEAISMGYRAALAAPERPEIRRRYEDILRKLALEPEPLIGEEIVVKGQ
jgi:hypothetical protein